MPLIYRVMTRDGEKPLVGSTARTLGVRIKSEEKKGDIPVNAQGYVEPNTGGMSVSPSWQLLPFFLVPKRLRHLVPGATGKNRDACWRMGEGEFVASAVADKLYLLPDKPKHGTVQPTEVVSLAEYRQALANTQHLWRIDED